MDETCEFRGIFDARKIEGVPESVVGKPSMVEGRIGQELLLSMAVLDFTMGGAKDSPNGAAVMASDPLPLKGAWRSWAKLLMASLGIGIEVLYKKPFPAVVPT